MVELDDASEAEVRLRCAGRLPARCLLCCDISLLLLLMLSRGEEEDRKECLLCATTERGQMEIGA